MFIYIFHEIFTYLLFPTLSFQHILKIPLPVNARFSYPSKNMSCYYRYIQTNDMYCRNEEGNKFFTYTCTLKT